MCRCVDVVLARGRLLARCSPFSGASTRSLNRRRKLSAAVGLAVGARLGLASNIDTCDPAIVVLLPGVLGVFCCSTPPRSLVGPR